MIARRFLRVCAARQRHAEPFLRRKSSLRGKSTVSGYTQACLYDICNPRKLFFAGTLQPPQKTSHSARLIGAGFASDGKAMHGMPLAGCDQQGHPDVSLEHCSQPLASACSRLGASAQRPKPPACSGSSRSPAQHAAERARVTLHDC